MARKPIKLEYQALRLAQKIDDKVFTHTFAGFGYLNFLSADLSHPTLVVNYGRAGQLIYDTVKQYPLEHYFKSYATKYGKGVVPRELIDYAYYQCNVDANGRLQLVLDFSKDSVANRYVGKPEVRVIDDLIMNDKHLSVMQCAFFHLFNTRLKDERWCAFQVDMQYRLDDKKISFAEFQDIMVKIGMIKREEIPV